jgi:hypothetical protein
VRLGAAARTARMERVPPNSVRHGTVRWRVGLGCGHGHWATLIANPHSSFLVRIAASSGVVIL